MASAFLDQSTQHGSAADHNLPSQLHLLVLTYCRVKKRLRATNLEAMVRLECIEKHQYNSLKQIYYMNQRFQLLSLNLLLCVNNTA